MTSSVVEFDIDVLSPVPALPELPKMAAVNRLRHALEARGLSADAADAIAVAVADPSEVRNLLEKPALMRVAGGILEVIYSDVWVPAVLPFPENPRMLPALSYAVEGNRGRLRPLPAAVADPNGSPELQMPVVSGAELIEHLDAQMQYLRDNNDLSTSVGNHGIREPLLLVPLSFESGTAPNELTAHLGAQPDTRPTMLSSVDGNSRLAAAYWHLRLDPGEVMTKLLGDPRAIRQRIGNTLALRRSDTPMSVDSEEALRSLVAPAAIIVGFQPHIDGRDLSDAIQSRLGAIHVAPPKQWNQASRYDLLLNVSLDALRPVLSKVAGSIDVEADDYCDWLAGNLSAEESVQRGLDPEPDFRAAALFWWFRRRDEAISGAIRRLDITGNVTPKLRANIAAEGAIRGFRSLLTPTEADNARGVLASLYQLDDLKGPWEPDDAAGLGTVAAATSEALSEIAALKRPGEMGRLLMIVSFYWLTRYRVVPLQTRGGQSDRRKMTDVLTTMCRTEHGIRVLSQVIKDGRAGRPPRAVDITGRIEVKNGAEILLSDEWIRQTWSRGRKGSRPASPREELRNRTEQLRELIREVMGALAGLREPLAGDGLPLVESTGLDISTATEMLEELDAIQEDITELRFVSKRTGGGV